MMRKNLGYVILVALTSLLIFWAPFILKIDQFWGINFKQEGMNAIVQNFDGLNFFVVAKSLYDTKIIEEINTKFETGNVPKYFSAHFPLYPLVIRVIGNVVPLPHALLLTIILANIFLSVALYYFFVTVIKNEKTALILTTVALFFPARMLSVRAVGSNEPLFIGLILFSLACAYRQLHLKAAILGSLAVLTRSPGILLFAGYFLSHWLVAHGSWREKFKVFSPYLLLPLTLLALFGFYASRYGSVLAYFQSGDNLHLFFPPFQIFSNMQSWINDMWREEFIYLYLFYGMGVYLLKEDKSRWFAYIYASMLLLVSHRDLARYALPLAPLAFVGYAKTRKVEKSMYIILLLLLIPIYLLGWQFVLSNMQPINDWSVFL